MMPRKLVILVIVTAGLPTLSWAADKPAALPRPKAGEVLSLLSGTNPDALAGSLRGYLAHNLPAMLYEASPGWGHMKEINGKEKNDGVWKKVRFSADNLPDTLILDLRNIQQPEPGRVTFDLFLSFDGRLDYERQRWAGGLRLDSNEIRARMRFKLILNCEATDKVGPTSGILPESVLRLHVVHSDLQYDNFVVEHVAGVGGEAAKVLGDAARSSLHRWKPELEHALLEKADAAIVKAGDTKEIHLGLARLLKLKN